MAEFAGAHAIDAAGGLAAVVRASYELEAAEKAKQIAGQVDKQVPAEARKGGPLLGT
jgi:hypothetical protein